MWNKPRTPVLARMPSTREQPLNPRAPAAPAGATTPPGAPEPAPAAPGADTAARERAAQAGAFHESSYELRTGLEVNESEWPEEVTIPAALGDR